jgi:glutathione synthase/RimK-type ligase-like ATP-grasp enzyme
MHEQRIFPQLIREVCDKYGWHFEAFSQDWFFQIHHEGKTLSIYGYKWGFNNGAAQLIADDKSATAGILEKNNINHIPHTLLLNPKHNQLWHPDQGMDSYVREVIKQQTFPIVIKPKNGSIGSHVYQAFSSQEAYRLVQKLFSLNEDVVLSPFISSEFEYRCIILDDEVVLVYSKELPQVQGNGKNTVREILKKRDPIGNETILLATLAHEILDEVIPDGEIQIISWKHNLSKGATARCVPNPDSELIFLARQAAGAIGLVLCSVDILYDVNTQQLKVLEINSGVSLNKCIPYIPEGKEKAKALYTKAIELYFKK